MEALEAATLHPATLLKIEKHKGTLAFGSDADFVFLKPNTLDVISTWIGGQCVYQNDKFDELITTSENCSVSKKKSSNS